jgi:hypothetical protein
MKTKLFLTVLCLPLLGACTLVNTRKLEALAFAKTSKDRADDAKDSPRLDRAKYLAARTTVNQWLDGISVKAHSTADQWLPLSQLSLGPEAIPAGLQDQVNAALASAEGGGSMAAAPGADLLLLLAEQIRAQARAGRQAEAKALEERLNTYKWKLP